MPSELWERKTGGFIRTKQMTAFSEIPQIPAQRLRILRSGLKPEPGAWERSKLRMEMDNGEWGLTAEAILAEKKRLAAVRRRHTYVTRRLPRSRKRAGAFRTECVLGPDTRDSLAMDQADA